MGEFNKDNMIYEDGYTMTDDFYKLREEIMTEEEIRRAELYIKKYDELAAQMEEKIMEFDEIEKLYKGEREKEYESDPNSFVNVILPQIEGQVSAMTNHNITAAIKGKGYSDQRFAFTVDPIARLILKENKIKQLIKKIGRRYLKFGNAAMLVEWDDEALDGFGLPKMKAPSITKVYIDSNIHDLDDIQEAEYIIVEKGTKSILWAKEEFGEDRARAVSLGNTREDFTKRFNTGNDNTEEFTYLEIWTRNNEQGNLQKIEMSKCGVILRESDPSTPYYQYVFNRYPIFMTGLYQEEEELHRFGDGKLLKPIQELINKLYDEIIIAIKFAAQSRTYADPKAKLNPGEFAEADPRKVLKATNPGQWIKTERGTGINQVVFNLLEQLFNKVQEMTRFSALMTGNDPGSSMTATQAGIQMQQGISGIDDKRGDISLMTSNALSYSIGLCMEFWEAAKAFRVSDNEDKFEWIDARKLKDIPEFTPATKDYVDKWRKNNPNKDPKEQPEWMVLNVDGKEATKQIEMDISVTIGEGMPSNKMALYNIIVSLAQLQLLDERTMQPRPLLNYKQVRDMIEEILGLKIKEDEKGKEQVQFPGGQNMPIPGGGPTRPLNQDANIPNANINGQAKGGMTNDIQ